MSYMLAITQSACDKALKMCYLCDYLHIRYKSPTSRDEPILLFFSPIFLSGNSFFLAYYAQYFARSCNILLQVYIAT